MQIDGNRGDIPRSKYIIRIIQGRIYPLANLNTGVAEQVAVPTALDVHKSTQPLLSDTNFKEEDYDIG